MSQLKKSMLAVLMSAMDRNERADVDECSDWDVEI